MHLISTMLTNDTTNMLPHHLSSFTLLPFIKSQLTSRQSFISRLFTNRRDHRSGMSSRLHPPNPPISGRLKIISLVGTRPTAQFAHPLEQSPRAASFLSFLSLVLTSPPPSYTMNKATLSPRFSFLSLCCVCGEINCELWNSVHPQPPLCIFSLEAGCLRVHTREREREKKEYTRVTRPESWKETCTVITPLTPTWRGKVCSWVAREYTRCFLSGSWWRAFDLPSIVRSQVETTCFPLPSSSSQVCIYCRWTLFKVVRIVRLRSSFRRMIKVGRWTSQERLRSRGTGKNGISVV